MPRRSTTGPQSEATRSRILDAAIETLKDRGFNGSTARAIATAGGVNPALIFYHFGTLNNLMLTVVDRMSGERLDDYRSALSGAAGLPELARVGAELYQRDLASGYTTVISELIAGSLAVPELRAGMLERLEPWLDLGADFIARLGGDLPILGLAAPRDIANGIAAFYLGMEVLTHLDGDHARFDPLFQMSARLAALATEMSPSPVGGVPRREEK